MRNGVIAWCLRPSARELLLDGLQFVHLAIPPQEKVPDSELDVVWLFYKRGVWLNYVTGDFRFRRSTAVLIYRHEIDSWQEEEAEYTANHELEISDGRCLGGICSYKLMAEMGTRQLVRQKGNTMKGRVPANRIAQFREQLKEGSVCTFEAFIVTDARKRYRTTDHPYRIKITQLTRIRPTVPQPENFPLFAYNAKPFQSLQTRIGDNTVLSDVVGLVTILMDIIPSKTNQDPRRNIHLKDASGKRAIVTLWGEHAEAFDAASLHRASSNDSIIILFVGMVVAEYAGMLAFKSTSFTHWHVNIPIPEIFEIGNSIGDNPHNIDWQGPMSTKAEPIETTVYALTKEEREALPGHRYRLNLIITKINNPTDWWFMSSRSCWKKVLPTRNKYKCTGTNYSSTGGIERYKLSVSAKDIEPNKENKEVIGQFMFFGEHGTTLTGYDVTLFDATSRGRADYIPHAISGVVGKRCIIVADVTQDALDSDNITFHVSNCEITSSPDPVAPSASTSKLHAATERSALLSLPTNIATSPADPKNSGATPAKDIIEEPQIDYDDDTSSTSTTKKIKNQIQTTESNKRSTTTNKNKTKQELFPPRKAA